MFVANDKTLHERILHLRGQVLAQHREYWHEVVAYKYRMTNISAAIGLAQLENVQEKLNQKRAITNLYKKELENLPLIICQEIGEVFDSYWIITILLDNNSNTWDDFRTYLSKNGIETIPSFYPIYAMPMYGNSCEKYPVTENLGWRGVNLPSYPNLKNKQINYITTIIEKYFE